MLRASTRTSRLDLRVHMKLVCCKTTRFCTFMLVLLWRSTLCLLPVVILGCFSSDSGDRTKALVEARGGFLPANGYVRLIVRNKTSNMIHISPYSWHGFGDAQPSDGFIGFGTKTMDWPWLQKTPAETIIVWSIVHEDESEADETEVVKRSGKKPKLDERQFAQTIDLKRLAAHSVKKLILFELQEDGLWRVYFDEEATEDWREFQESLTKGPSDCRCEAVN